LGPPYKSLRFSIQRVKAGVCLAGVAVCLNVLVSRSSPFLNWRTTPGFLSIIVGFMLGSGFIIGRFNIQIIFDSLSRFYGVVFVLQCDE
jgi:uncharacterized membrane protein HdeD (DUF308 family)